MLWNGQKVAAPPTSTGVVYMYGIHDVKVVIESREKGSAPRGSEEKMLAGGGPWQAVPLTLEPRFHQPGTAVPMLRNGGTHDAGTAVPFGHNIQFK